MPDPSGAFATPPSTGSPARDDAVVTAAAWGAFAAFGVLALGDWWAVGGRRLGAEYVFKPTSLGALLAAAVLLDPTHDAMRVWFVFALGLSLAGDVFLMLPRRPSGSAARNGDRFVPGLASFLLAHVAYAVGLNLDGGSAAALALAAGGVAVVAVALGIRVVRAARAHDRRLTLPVALYIVVISAMVTSALATGRSWAAAGALLFYTSDALIGWTRFIRQFRGHRVAVMVTYHLGQLGLVVSLLS